MTKSIPSTEELEKMFADIQSNDPKITIDDGVITMNPYYWNYSFVTNFPLIPVFVYILMNKKSDLETILLGILGIAIFLFNIYHQLKFYNKLTINLRNKNITVSPNIITALYTKEETIPFSSIKTKDYAYDGFRLAYRRYIIRITINSCREIKLISTRKEDNAKKIVGVLMQLL